MDPKEVADGKVLAIIGYIFGIVAIVMLFVRNNNFVLYHAKQMTVVAIIWIAAGICVGIIGTVLAAVTKGFGACIIPVGIIGLNVAMLVLVVIGIINAANGVCKPLPVVGAYAEKWFAGIKKAGT